MRWKLSAVELAHLLKYMQYYITIFKKKTSHFSLIFYNCYQNQTAQLSKTRWWLKVIVKVCLRYVQVILNLFYRYSSFRIILNLYLSYSWIIHKSFSFYHRAILGLSSAYPFIILKLFSFLPWIILKLSSSYPQVFLKLSSKYNQVTLKLSTSHL